MSVLSLIPEDKKRGFSSKEVAESVYSSRTSSKQSGLDRKKRMNSMLNGTSSSTSVNGKSEKYVTQRVLSAKTHRVKQLQNQLTDAHYHLNELSNENKILRAMLKKQEIALQRYESSNAELPSMLNSHSEEMRIQQAKYKQLKQQHKEILQKVKERETQLQHLKEENHHLHELAKERNLLEREKLQAQLAQLQEKVQKQNETISVLQRRLVLEQKNFKHQLYMEQTKHRDTKQDLESAVTNADKLNSLLEIKERVAHTLSKKTLSKPHVGKDKTLRTAKSENTIHQQHEKETEYLLQHKLERNLLTRASENSRALSSSLSEEDTVSPLLDRVASANQSRPATRKSLKSPLKSPELIDLAKTVQNGMADLTLFKPEIQYKVETKEEIELKINSMKEDLLKKIRNGETPSGVITGLRKNSGGSITGENSEEHPKSGSRRRNSAISFKGFSQEQSEYSEKGSTQTNKTLISESNQKLPIADNSKLQEYCTNLATEMERNSQIIDMHLKEFKNSRIDDDKIMEQLDVVDRINDIVIDPSIPENTLKELNNNVEKVLSNTLAPTKVFRVIGTKEVRKPDNAFGDSKLTNKDLLDDLLGRK